MKIQSFTVLPDTPEKLKALDIMAHNLYFAWNPEVVDLFQKLDEELWDTCKGNPVRMLSLIPQETLEAAVEDRNYLAQLEAVFDRFKRYMEEPSWFERQFEKKAAPEICYFCAEFGIHECLPIYSGGLGVLAGDHIKSSSDLGLPLIGMGLLYRHGYFQQHLNAEGVQQERYLENDLYGMPIQLVRDKKGDPVTDSLFIGNEKVYFQIWQVYVGRTSIYLLDTNVENNDPSLRIITNNLYDANRDIRIRQEILLGIGGIKALKALDLHPKIFHVNEGHSSFLILERIRNLMTNDKLTFDEAKEFISATTVFTTHTPVPAGNEHFSTNTIEGYFNTYIKELGISIDELLSFGRKNPADKNEEFCMTVLPLKFSSFANGVSKLHGEVSRNMWKDLYKEISSKEIPIGHITNGVHSKSWLSPRLRNLFLRYLKISTADELLDFEMWSKTNAIPDQDFWELHEFKRKRLIDFVRAKVRKQLLARHAGSGELADVDSLLNPKALTIGFSRRFATYKRGSLFMRNPERLKEIVNKSDKPIQFIIAGKAHPADQAGKDIIRSIVSLSKQPDFKNRIVFLENYDIDVARHLVQGVDVWLNTPIRLMEASGTSGMKAAINGALNLSILDGWWDEAYTPEVGWGIGLGELYTDTNIQNDIESDLLYGLLEREIIPLFYERDNEDVPGNWVAMMKNSISQLGNMFNSHRMVQEYMDTYYIPAIQFSEKLSANGYAESKTLATWRKNLKKHWDEIKITRISEPSKDFMYKGSDLEIRAWVKLGAIKPENVKVECYHGLLDNNNTIIRGERVTMSVVSTEDEDTVFSGHIPCSIGGHYGYTVRILPGHTSLACEYQPGLIKWHE